MNSFYGGPNGAPFKISKIFETVSTNKIIFEDNFDSYDTNKYSDLTQIPNLSDFYYFDKIPSNEDEFHFYLNKWSEKDQPSKVALHLRSFTDGNGKEQRCKIDFAHDPYQISGPFKMSFQFSVQQAWNGNFATGDRNRLDKPGFTFNPFGGYYFGAEKSSGNILRINVRSKSAEAPSSGNSYIRAKINGEQKDYLFYKVQDNIVTDEIWDLDYFSQNAEKSYIFEFELKLNHCVAKIYSASTTNKPLIAQASLANDASIINEDVIAAPKELSLNAFAPIAYQNKAWKNAVVLQYIEFTSLQEFDAMRNDLMRRWQSNIGVDEYVLVSYGLYGEKTDRSAVRGLVDYHDFKRSFNATLWQKVYNEMEVTNAQIKNYDFIFANGATSGWGYKFIASMAGKVPTFSIKHKTIEASEDHRVELSFADGNTAIDKPILTFYEPKAWEFGFTKRTIEANQNPTAEFYAVAGDDVTNNNNATDEDKPNITSEEHSIKHLDLQLPKAWQFTHNLQTDLEANQNATMAFYGVDGTNKKTEGPHSKKKLEIHLPKAWQFEKAEDRTLRANEKPEVTFTPDDKDNDGKYSKQIFQFSLPEAWDFGSQFEAVSAASEPKFTILTSTENNKSIKTLQFELPKAWNFTLAKPEFTSDPTKSGAILDSDPKTSTKTLRLTVYQPQDLDILDPYKINGQDPSANMSFESYFSSTLTDDLNLNKKYSTMTSGQVLPVTYKDTTTSLVTSCWVFKNSNGTWGYSVFGGTKLVSQKLDNTNDTYNEIAQNTTYSALLVDKYLDLTKTLYDTIAKIQTSWHVYYDTDLETAVMMNVAHRYDSTDGIVIIDGNGTAMTAQLDGETLIIDYPEKSNLPEFDF